MINLTDGELNFNIVNIGVVRMFSRKNRVSKVVRSWATKFTTVVIAF